MPNVSLRAGFSWWEPGAQLTWGHEVGDCKILKIKNARLVSNKIMKGLVGGPLLVGGLGPGPPAPY